ncbi:Lipopolysaccharide-induced tumor necrosis factor-alpha factor like [Dissostichus eleginoides]|uniref:Lipopolysaccharide-induced tumor necrosis factor-alpha factor like n=1 Tax=Dissostichus eleginoides TaxID=100907 RepID=A0AAD9F5P3_DISEL|nr:Lipopolysaccharide-induced tumor necrosis factor-alpha factor like [Dissostichus eleginoides]
MEPPSYEESRLYPPALSTAAFKQAVTIQPNLFPVLTLPNPRRTRNTGVITHPVTQIGVTHSLGGRRSQPVVVTTQPLPVPISVTHLGDVPGVVRCSHCHHIVTTKVSYLPGRAAWCMCFLLTMIGLICGCCLIPLTIKSLQDAHHSCPQCGNELHTYKR